MSANRGGNPPALLRHHHRGAARSGADTSRDLHQHEFAADRGTVSIVGSPYGLANALRKCDRGARRLSLKATPATAHMFIMKRFGDPVSSLFSTYPPTEARIPTMSRNISDQICTCMPQRLAQS